ncbi:glycoside hydrolase family 2 TIM barrel-domain containing protein [Nocardiopsis sp. N85]|uniref:glycoside hydrolase family 2 TIM barrel-domain containing protein n=1 Tax=Nocardiopsis sp. N85 TaxID=3029400 RepID=UPI00237F1E6C|nr:glycoside hydrolase family 2 TIM barrel-domain containing protein [Nocardiopsis sp. N85]MDE3721943.1 glycoside hydrolase family 2 TIM barrel-domain containing protein [Nocardiopsis sp. N85]
MTITAFNDGWAHRRKVSAFAELGGVREDWTTVTLPHDALIGTPRRADAPGGAAAGYFPGGAFEYRKDLLVEESDRGRCFFLEFDGVYRGAMVYVNGALAGQHAFGYSRFTVRIDPFLRFGGVNEIRVECRAHLDGRWYTGAGIYRDVRLIVKEPVHIAVDGVRISTPDIEPDRAVVEIVAEVVNTGAVTTTAVLASAVDDEGRAEVARDRSPVTVPPGERAIVRHRLYVEDPALWDVDTPSLYTARLLLRDGDRVLDEHTVEFGVRRVQVDPRKGLRINGRTVKLRGACLHHDNGPLGAAAIERAEERRVESLKAAGFNAIRSSHNPVGSALLRACDRLGMLVMDETFDVWTSGKTDFDYAGDFAEWWERDVEALVAKDFNHPSVILYSIGNEIPETGTPFGGVWSRRIAEKVRSLDDTRLITNGVNGFVSVLDVVLAGARQATSAEPPAGGGGVNGMMTQAAVMMNQVSASEEVTGRTEESFSVLDVAGMNYGDGRYELDRELFPGRVIVGTETFPVRAAQNWSLVLANDHVIGDFTWTGWDYLGEAGLGSVGYGDSDERTASVAQPYPWLTAWCGDIDITGQRRPVSYYREIVFGLRSTPYIAVRRPRHHGRTVLATPWSWSDAIGSWTWEGFEGKPVHVEVYSDADEVELLLDGTTVGRRPAGPDHGFRADFELSYAPGELVAVAYTGGREQGRFGLVTAGEALALDVRADRSDLRADSGDLAFVDIVLTDGAGNAHPGRDRPVTVTVDGPAVLQALGSADPATEETFSGPSRRTFDGRALAVIRPTGAGDITVTVHADGCGTARLALRAGAVEAVERDALVP